MGSPITFLIVSFDALKILVFHIWRWHGAAPRLCLPLPSPSASSGDPLASDGMETAWSLPGLWALGSGLFSIYIEGHLESSSGGGRGSATLLSSSSASSDPEPHQQLPLSQQSAEALRGPVSVQTSLGPIQPRTGPRVGTTAYSGPLSS